MLISEIYNSRQGEGLLAGTPSVFVRTSGCNLRCHFCDTPFASWNPTGQTMEVKEIIDRVYEVSQDPLPEMVTGKQEDFVGPARHVVITGGEPMLPRDISELTKLLRAAKFHITIETAGTIDREIACDLISISPKMANSTPTAQHVGSERAGEWAERHDDTRCRIDVVKSLIRDREYQLKFVVAEPEDLDEIESYLDALGCGPLVDAGGRTEAGRDSIDRSRVLLMPEGVDNATLEKREAWLKPACESKGFTYCHRLHIQWYGNRRAT